LHRQAAPALLFRLTWRGAVRTQTLRNFDLDEMQSILDRSGA
jgi:uncharacterized protein with GYD domain